MAANICDSCGEEYGGMAIYCEECGCSICPACERSTDSGRIVCPESLEVAEMRKDMDAGQQEPES